jgi:FlaA1/EpsC-like NDP-sugar epimerase
VLTLRNRHFFFIDLALLPAVAVMSFALRLDAAGMLNWTSAILVWLVLSVPIKVLVFYWFGLYRQFWRYASVDELVLIALATAMGEVVAAALLFAIIVPLSGIDAFPRSIPFIDGLLTFLVVGGPRFAVRLAEQRRERQRRHACWEPEKPVLVMGAGSAGAMIVKEMKANPQLGLEPVGFLDDDRGKHGFRISGVPVLGGRKEIPDLVEQHGVAEVIIAMPTAPGVAIREILTICSEVGIPARTIPGLYDILSGQVSVSQLRKVDIEDLLRRDPVQTDVTAVGEMLRGCRVMVTGAGGSIGSELCRQISRCRPENLILVGHGENSVFAIANELRWQWPDLSVEQVIADVRDRDRLSQVFDAFQPDTIFHAAAHKHVPLMETNVADAVTNNVKGTTNLLHLAEAHLVGRFVFISTDKAVNPSSVMGATKRVAELLVQDSASRSGLPYVAVRFGNVLGSSGSVVPLFREQIARGGPVTITHPDVRRYFMTIPEAVQLVLQAAALGEGAEVFMLDMGAPIRIEDLAKDLIKLSGLEVGRDVEIEYTGLRPGEKMFEELSASSEEYVATRHEKIAKIRNGAQSAEHSSELWNSVNELIHLAGEGHADEMRHKLKEIVPEYSAQPESGGQAGGPRGVG